jgi:ribosomal protein L16 Arg81 hydroxylase
MITEECPSSHHVLSVLFLSQAVLDRYQALLREYRLHKQSLGDWFSGVLRQQRRQPQLLDAQATGDEALVAR